MSGNYAIMYKDGDHIKLALVDHWYKFIRDEKMEEEASSEPVKPKIMTK